MLCASLATPMQSAVLFAFFRQARPPRRVVCWPRNGKWH